MGKAPQVMIFPWNSIPFGVVASPLGTLVNDPHMLQRPTYSKREQLLKKCLV